MGRPDLYQKLFAGDTIYMAVVYTLNSAVEMCFIYVMLFTDYSVVLAHPFYTWFYGLSSGALILLAFGMIIGILLRVSPFKRIPRIFAMAGIQLGVIIVDILYAALHGGWWVDGYVFLALEMLFLAAYGRRLNVLIRAKGEAAGG